MADASYVWHSFLGGFWSKSMQGRVDRPDYRNALNECLNAIPTEQGAWQRRSGTQFAGATRGGLPGRVISFDFKQSSPYTMEFTDGHLRFRDGATIVTDDSATIQQIGIFNPAVVVLTKTVTWQTGDQVIARNLGTGLLQLQNRQLVLTKISSSQFSIADAITGAGIDGSTLGAVPPGAVLTRIVDIATPYISGAWNSSLLRGVQADIDIQTGTTPGMVLLSGSFSPYLLQVTAQPTPTAFATFSLAPASLKDGPYLDPFTNGVQANPSAKKGIITITLSFPAYDSGTAYAVGAFVTSASINYESLVDQNVGNTPASSPSQWAPVSASLAISPGGFQGTDIGRFVRFFSEPPLWDPAASYTTGQLISYNPSGVPGGATYWVALTSTTGNIPGTDLTHWSIATNAALWSWGKITSLATQISQTLAGSINFGTMTSNGGVNAAFDGITAQADGACAMTGTNFPGGTFSPTPVDCSIGKNYSASPQQIASGTCWPSTNESFGIAVNAVSGAFEFVQTTVNLRAKQTAPTSPSDGTLLGSSGAQLGLVPPVSITSNDQATAWNYVWFEIINQYVSGNPVQEITALCAEAQFFNPQGSSSSGNAINVEILGPALLYTTSIRTWRLGLYSGSTGWPTCGTWHEGRLWLAGAIVNRVDASVANDALNFAPTNSDGSVSDDRAIDYSFNAPDVNPIFWMSPESQGIFCGTQAGEWLIQATTLNSPLSPTNIQAHRYTRNGCANIEPRRTEHTLIVVQRFKRDLLEFFADVFSGKYSAQDIIHKAKVLTKAFIAEVAYQQQLSPIVWARMNDGSLAGVTYKRDSLLSSQEPTFAAAHRHALGSGRIVESITTSATTDGNLDALTMVTNSTTDNVRHVEIMQPLWEEGNAPNSGWFLDDAIQPTSVAPTSVSSPGAPYGGVTLGGLWHLVGKTVQVSINGIDCGMQEGGQTFIDFTVAANGSVFVPYGDGVSAGSGAGQFTQAVITSALQNGSIVVGFTYNSDGQIVNPHLPQDTGARSGPGFGKLKRHQRYAIKVYDSCGMQIGTSFTKMLPILFKSANGRNATPGTFFQGLYFEEIQDDYARESMICWRAARPYPANIAIVGGYLHTQDV